MTQTIFDADAPRATFSDTFINPEGLESMEAVVALTNNAILETVASADLNSDNVFRVFKPAVFFHFIIAPTNQELSETYAGMKRAFWATRFVGEPDAEPVQGYDALRLDISRLVFLEQFSEVVQRIFRNVGSLGQSPEFVTDRRVGGHTLNCLLGGLQQQLSVLGDMYFGGILHSLIPPGPYTDQESSPSH